MTDRQSPGAYFGEPWPSGVCDDGHQVHSPIARTFDTLDQARDSLPLGLARLEREPGDDPVIIESWL